MQKIGINLKNFSQFSRPLIKLLEYDEEALLVYKQSQKSSAKIALLVDDILTTFYDSENKGQNPWNQLDERFFAVTIGIATLQSSFYFRIIKDTVDRLTDTGVIRHLINTRVLMLKKYPKDESEPKILSLEDLSYGFNIFLGFCLISGLIFIVELILGLKFCRKNMSFNHLRKKLRNTKIKFTKVKPMNTIECLIFARIPQENLDVLSKFRIRKNPVENYFN